MIREDPYIDNPRRSMARGSESSQEKRRRSNDILNIPSRSNNRAERQIKSVEQSKIRGRNYIKDNMMRVIMDNTAAVKKKKMAEQEVIKSGPEMHRNYGKVPRYIHRYAHER